MTDRLIVRVTIRDAATGPTAGISQPGTREGTGSPASKRRRAWVAGAGAAAGLSIIAALSLAIDFSETSSKQGGVAESAVGTNDRNPAGPVDGRLTAMPWNAVTPPADAINGVPGTLAAANGEERATDGSIEISAGMITAAGEPEEENIGSNLSDQPIAPDAQIGNASIPQAAGAAQIRPPMATQAPEPAAESSIDDPRVLRAQLSAGISGREPTGSVKLPLRMTDRSGRTIYFFSEVRDLDGKTVFHRWEREGSVLASIPFEIRGERWRIYSNKTITPQLAGNWRVVLADSNGTELASSAFLVR